MKIEKRLSSTWYWLLVWGILLLFLISAAIVKNTRQQPPKEIRIKAIAGLKYDIVRFAVKPGETVKIIFENTDDMAHNMVFTSPGKREEIVKAAQMLGGEGAAKNYIPDTEDVLFSSKVLGNNETNTITFTTPDKEGVYPYVCTYPGHGLVMFGAMYVTENPLPPLENDLNVPEGQRSEAFAAKPESPHPYLMTYPMMYRTFMPECSPAAIAVAMTEKHAYCWDAGKCFIRYSWEGGFLDNTAHWKGNGNALSEIQGKVYFKHQDTFPFSVGTPDSISAPKFKGYQIDKAGLPVFKYQLNATLFKEKVKPLAEGTGLSIQYELENINTKLFYNLPKGNDFNITCNKGMIEAGILTLSSEEARNFTLTITALNQ
jgi:plastocyanin